MRYRGGRHSQQHEKTFVCACHYWYELTDGYWGQFALTQIPHFRAQNLLPSEYKHLESTKNFADILEYLCSWVWSETDGHIITADGVFAVVALPLVVGDDGSA